MKKYISRVIFAALAMLSACENMVTPDDFISEGDLLFTARIGTDTKTYLEWDETDGVYKTRWLEGDTFFLFDASEEAAIPEICKLQRGEGTSIGMFSGSMEASDYVALYANGGEWDGNSLYVNLAHDQYHYRYSAWKEYKPFLNDCYPMVAMSDSKDFDFYNLCSILKFTVVGDGAVLQKIRVRSNDGELLSGKGVIDFSGDVPAMAMVEGNTELDYYIYETLSDIPLECHIVLPAQAYNKGFTIEFYSERGWMDVTTGENITLEQSKIHEIKDPITFVHEHHNWYIRSSWSDTSILSYEDGVYVAHRCRIYGDVILGMLDTDMKWSLASQYSMDFYPIHAKVNIEQNDRSVEMAVWEFVDIYLYPETLSVYFKEPSLDDSQLPDRDTEYISSFSLLKEVDDGKHVMVSGIVQATSEKGYVISLGYHPWNKVLVYDDGNYLSHLVPGQLVDLYIEKMTFGELPALVAGADSWQYTWSSHQVEYDDDLDVSMFEQDLFNEYQGLEYDMVSYGGTLVKEGDVYYVEVDGVIGRRGELFYPSQDISSLVGKRVEVKGVTLGFTDKGNLLTMVYSIVSEIDTSSATEDFFSGDDILM